MASWGGGGPARCEAPLGHTLGPARRPVSLSLRPAPQPSEPNLGAWWTHNRSPDRCAGSRWLFTAPDLTPALRSQHSSSVVTMAAACHRSPAGQALAAGRGRSCRSSRPRTSVSGPPGPGRRPGWGSCCTPTLVCRGEGCFLGQQPGRLMGSGPIRASSRLPSGRRVCGAPGPQGSRALCEHPDLEGRWHGVGRECGCLEVWRGGTAILQQDSCWQWGPLIPTAKGPRALGGRRLEGREQPGVALSAELVPPVCLCEAGPGVVGTCRACACPQGWLPGHLGLPDRSGPA